MVTYYDLKFLSGFFIKKKRRRWNWIPLVNFNNDRSLRNFSITIANFKSSNFNWYYVSY